MKYYYLVLLVISVICSGIYLVKWRKNYSIYYTITFVLIPLANLGYLWSSEAENLREMLLAQKVIYLGGCFLLTSIMFYVFELCHIRLNRFVKIAISLISGFFYFLVLTIEHRPWFYRSVSFMMTEEGPELIKDYAYTHTLFHIFVIIEFAISFGALFYALQNRKDTSVICIRLILFTQAFSVVSFFLTRRFSASIELLPTAYVIDQIIYLIIAGRTMLYDIGATVSDSVEAEGNIGFASFDFEYNYLGCNAAALEYLPILKLLSIDRCIKNVKESGRLVSWIDEYAETKVNPSHTKAAGDKYIRYDIGYLNDGRKNRGYQIMMTDVTEEQKYLKLIRNYNEDLTEEVERKTAHIQTLQDSMVLGMATMVESRDNSTGGHIRRTSDVVKILMDEIMKDDSFDIDEEFCKNVIKAAPMHDLGKIAVDDEILRKPGKFTPEEFDKMKAHAAEGAKVVRKILENIDDEAFKIVAENVAHFHHERIDGSGYPEGLKGDEIPLEARIMAVADVWDALVSKRCYKDSMSFDAAAGIIEEGMGRHFDMRLKNCFEKVRPRLEEYYKAQVNEE